MLEKIIYEIIFETMIEHIFVLLKLVRKEIYVRKNIIFSIVGKL